MYSRYSCTLSFQSLLSKASLFLPFLLWDRTNSCKKKRTWSLYHVCPFPLVAPCAIVTTTSPCRDFLQPARCFVGKDTTKNNGEFIRFSCKRWQHCFHWDIQKIRSTSRNFLPSAVSPIFGTLGVFNFSMYKALTNLSQRISRHSHFIDFIDLNQLHRYRGFYLSLLWKTCHMTQNKMFIPSRYTGWLGGVPIMGQQPNIHHCCCFKTCR